MNKDQKKYVGIHNDLYGGMTDTGKVIRDAWIFGFIPETETCEGWLVAGIQALMEKNNAEWEKYGLLARNLPPELRARFDRIQQEAVERATQLGWNPTQDLSTEV